MRFVKCKACPEIFKIIEQVKCWIGNWDTFVFIAEQMGISWQELLDQVEEIPFEELRDSYPVGETMVKKTITTIVAGEKPREIFYPVITIQKMSILGTCLPNTPIEHMKSLGFTRFIGNREGWPHHDAVEQAGLKLFINIHPYDHSVPSNEWINQKVTEHKDRAYCGGFWSDTAGGEEPDARHRTKEEAAQCLADRIRFKAEVRKNAPDPIKWPVVEQFDLTEEGVVGGLWRPGWKNMYDELTLDILLFDCYVFDESDQKMRDDIRMFYDRFPGKYCKGIQVIPQMNAFAYRPGSIRIAYNTWKECLGKPMAVAFYKDETVRKDEQMQQEIREVNQEVMS